MTNNLSFKNISWLLASIAMVLAPHLLRLPPWASVLCVALVLWRLYIAWHSLHLPPRWLLLMLSLTVVGGTYLNYGTIFARDSGVTLLALLTAMKLMEMYSQRDAMIVVFLGYFIVITNFLYSQTILTALYMLLAVLVITATLVGFNHTSERQTSSVQLRFASVLLVQSIPLMLILFVFFPRVQGPLWGLPQDTYSGISGLSNTMTPGSISQLILSDEVAFRVNFEGVIPKPDQLYWRGPVFWYFNGKNWLPGKKTTRGSFKYERLEKRVQYTVTLEPHNNHWLFALDMPAMLPPESTGSNDYQVLSRTPVRSRMRYKMASYLSYKVGLDADEKELYRALQLPPDTNIGGNKRARALAASWRQDIDSDEAIMRKALSMFRNQKFHYTLLPPLLGDNQVDEFLFDTLQGFCEHYSSSFVFLMRSAGIPARVVTGYLGGQINLVGNY
ncbi:MAG: transglutaminaseTgpA domain-containing protein, partial [Nitrosomonadaceae bacterium]